MPSRQSGLNILEVLVAIIVVMVLFVLIMPSFIPVPRGSMIKTACLSNIKQLGTGLSIYQSDYDERLPLSKNWMRDSWPYIKNYAVFQCPVVRKEMKGYGYALNDSFEGKRIDKLPNLEKKVVLFESSNLKFNAHDALKSVMKPGRHTGGNNYNFLDGHSKFYKDTTPLP